jgi:hypothetical protein
VKEVEMDRMRRWRGKEIGLWYSSDEISSVNLRMMG